MIGNDYLYNELLDYCSGDLYELERTLKYFESRLASDMMIDNDNNNEIEESEED